MEGSKALLDGFQELHLDQQAWAIMLHLMFFFFWFHEVERCLCRHFKHVCKIWDNDLSDLVQNLKKS